MNPVGFRFRPNDEEIVDHYLRPKNLDSDTSHVDEVISTVDICSFDPWDLPCKSSYFFPNCCIEFEIICSDFLSLFFHSQVDDQIKRWGLVFL